MVMWVIMHRAKQLVNARQGKDPCLLQFVAQLGGPILRRRHLRAKHIVCLTSESRDYGQVPDSSKHVKHWLSNNKKTINRILIFKLLYIDEIKNHLMNSKKGFVGGCT